MVQGIPCSLFQTCTLFCAVPSGEKCHKSLNELESINRRSSRITFWITPDPPEDMLHDIIRQGSLSTTYGPTCFSLNNSRKERRLATVIFRCKTSAFPIAISSCPCIHHDLKPTATSAHKEYSSEPPAFAQAVTIAAPPPTNPSAPVPSTWALLLIPFCIILTGALTTVVDMSKVKGEGVASEDSLSVEEVNETHVGWWLRAISIFAASLKASQLVLSQWATLLGNETLFSVAACCVTVFFLLCQDPQMIGRIVLACFRFPVQVSQASQLIPIVQSIESKIDQNFLKTDSKIDQVLQEIKEMFRGMKKEAEEQVSRHPPSSARSGLGR